MKITFTITEEHLSQGKRVMCTLCPAALALGEQFPKGFISVGYNTVDMVIPEGEFSAFTTRGLKSFINRYDARMPLPKQRTFTLNFQKVLTP
jgi:hypothetical protein